MQATYSKGLAASAAAQNRSKRSQEAAYLSAVFVVSGGGGSRPPSVAWYCSIMSMTDGCLTPDDAFLSTAENPARAFCIGVEAKIIRHKLARHTAITPRNRRAFSKSDAV